MFLFCASPSEATNSCVSHSSKHFSSTGDLILLTCWLLTRYQGLHSLLTAPACAELPNILYPKPCFYNSYIKYKPFCASKRGFHGNRGGFPATGHPDVIAVAPVGQMLHIQGSSFNAEEVADGCLISRSVAIARL